MTQPSASHSQQSGLADWPLRPWLLGGLLAAAGLVIFLLTDSSSEVPWRVAGAAFAFFGAMAAAFSVDRDRWQEPVIFAVIAGVVMAGLAYHATDNGDHLAGEQFGFAAGVLALLLALPLFQAGFHRTRFATPYVETHFHVWTDAVSAGGALLFTGLSWLLLVLLNGLFELVNIHIIGDLLDDAWFGWMWSGAAFGASLGVLRNNLKVIGALQSVVLLVLSLLAVPLALALIVFLIALILSGGSALWEATNDATPILLACAAGSFIFANAIIRQDDEQRSQNRVMQIAALVLACGILPLTVFAAISMGIRIHQYGLAPERIWALIAIAVAVAYGLAYAVGIARGRMAGWSAQLRRANLNLAAGVCGLALLLALPLLNFGGISASNQIARLKAGKVSAEKFDYTALRWDFGDAGRRALARLADGEGKTAELAVKAQAQKTRYNHWDRERVVTDFAANLQVQPNDPALRAQVLAYLESKPWHCSDYCVAVDLGKTASGRQRIALVQNYGFQKILLGEGGIGTADDEAEINMESPQLNKDSTVEIREMSKRYIFIDGKPMNQPIDEAPLAH